MNSIQSNAHDCITSNLSLSLSEFPRRLHCTWNYTTPIFIGWDAIGYCPCRQSSKINSGSIAHVDRIIHMTRLQHRWCIANRRSRTLDHSISWEREMIVGNRSHISVTKRCYPIIIERPRVAQANLYILRHVLHFDIIYDPLTMGREITLSNFLVTPISTCVDHGTSQKVVERDILSRLLRQLRLSHLTSSMINTSLMARVKQAASSPSSLEILTVHYVVHRPRPTSM